MARNEKIQQLILEKAGRMGPMHRPRCRRETSRMAYLPDQELPQDFSTLGTALFWTSRQRSKKKSKPKQDKNQNDGTSRKNPTMRTRRRLHWSSHFSNPLNSNFRILGQEATPLNLPNQRNCPSAPTAGTFTRRLAA